MWLIIFIWIENAESILYVKLDPDVARSPQLDCVMESNSIEYESLKHESMRWNQPKIQSN